MEKIFYIIAGIGEIIIAILSMIFTPNAWEWIPSINFGYFNWFMWFIAVSIVYLTILYGIYRITLFIRERSDKK